MAITSAIMQMRRGLEADFDPDKMRPGEWAVSTDKKYVRMCFSVGVCVRMATYDAFEEDMAKIEEILSTCETIEEAVSKINTEVSTNAQAVAEYTKQAKKYRDEAKKFRDEAESIAGIGIATKDKAGIVKPDGTTITVDEDGTMHSVGGGGTAGTTDYADLENKPKINGVELSGNKTLSDLKITTADSKDNTVTFSQADTREKILSNEKHSTLFGKIAKWLSDLKTVAFSGRYSDLSDKPSSLDTYEEIMANTESGKFAGALGVQEGFETLTNSLVAKTQWIISEHKYPSSSDYATHTGINHFRNNHNEIIVAVVVGGNIFTLNIPLSLLPINSDIRLRIGNSVADIIVFFSNANEGTLQLERCIIDNVEYNTNSAVAFIYGVR